MGFEGDTSVKFLFWVGVGVWLVPQIDKYVYSYLDRKKNA